MSNELRRLIGRRYAAVKGQLGKHQWNIRLLDYLTIRYFVVYQILVTCHSVSVADTSSQPIYLTTVLPTPIILFTKLTFLILYLQLFRPIRALRICIYAGMIFTLGFYGSVTVATFYFVTPRRGQPFSPDAFYGSLGEKAMNMAIPISVVSVVTDFYILIVPIVAVLRLQLVKKRKIGLCLVFGTGSM